MPNATHMAYETACWNLGNRTLPVRFGVRLATLGHWHQCLLQGEESNLITELMGLRFTPVPAIVMHTVNDPTQSFHWNNGVIRAFIFATTQAHLVHRSFPPLRELALNRTQPESLYNLANCVCSYCLILLLEALYLV